MKRRALFLDRDGVINLDAGYVHRIEDFHFRRGIFPLCHMAKERKLPIIVVTNQSGIARGLYTEEQFSDLTDWMKGRFRREGAPLEAVYYCPHHPDLGMGSYRKSCDCRKPEPGLILRAASELNLDLANSALLGDRMIDMEAARRAGIGGRFLLSTGREDELEPNEAVCSSLITARRALAEWFDGRQD